MKNYPNPVRILQKSIITPLKNPTRRVGGTKPEALVL